MQWNSLRPFIRPARPLGGLCLALAAALPVSAQKADAPPVEVPAARVVIGGAVDMDAPVVVSTFTDVGGSTFSFGSADVFGGFDGTASLRWLLEPRFDRRALPGFVGALDLDDDQASVLELLLQDYMDAFELEAEQLRAMLGRWEEGRHQRRMADALAMAERMAQEFEDELDGEGERPAVTVFEGGPEGTVGVMVLDRTASDAGGGGGDGDGGGADAPVAVDVAISGANVAVSYTEAASEIDDERWSDLMERIEARRQAREKRRKDFETLGPVDGAELLAAARAFASLRMGLEESFEVDLDGILTDGQRASMQSALDAQLIRHELPHGRFGGESIDLDLLVGRVLGGERGDDLDERLVEHHTALALVMAERAQTMRELDLDVLGRAVADERRREQDFERTEAETLADRRARMSEARRASVVRTAVRDEILQTLDALAVSIEATDAATATELRDAAMAAGFSDLWAPTWGMRRLERAMSLDSIDDAQREALEALQAAMEAEHAVDRMEAILQRIELQPGDRERELRVEFALADGTPPEEVIAEMEKLGAAPNPFTKLEADMKKIGAILTPEQRDAVRGPSGGFTIRGR